MTYHGSQFFANEAEGRRRGQTAFEAEIERLGIRHVVARVRRPQANAKIERVHKEIERRRPPPGPSRPWRPSGETGRGATSPWMARSTRRGQ